MSKRNRRIQRVRRLHSRNRGTEAINGIIELHRRIARGFRNLTNYRLGMILAAGRLTHPNLR
jgi:transposase